MTITEPAPAGPTVSYLDLSNLSGAYGMEPPTALCELAYTTADYTPVARLVWLTLHIPTGQLRYDVGGEGLPDMWTLPDVWLPILVPAWAWRSAVRFGREIADFLTGHVYQPGKGVLSDVVALVHHHTRDLRHMVRAAVSDPGRYPVVELVSGRSWADDGTDPAWSITGYTDDETVEAVAAALTVDAANPPVGERPAVVVGLRDHLMRQRDGYRENLIMAASGLAEEHRRLRAAQRAVWAEMDDMRDRARGVDGEGSGPVPEWLAAALRPCV